MLILLLSVLGAEAGPGLDNIAVDPVRAWAVILSMFAVPGAAVVTAQISAKKRSADAANAPPPSVVITGSVTPHIDASQALLATVVGNVEERARLAEAKYDELEERHVKLVREAARAELQVELLTSQIRDLRAEINVLQGRLMGSGH